MEDNGIRLNKFLAEAGVASRRQADALIAEGHVTIRKRGEAKGTVAENGRLVLPGDSVYVDGVDVTHAKKKKVYLMLNKPRGIVCTSNTSDPYNVISFVNSKEKVTYVGRLDKDSTGLLLLTNDGDLNNRIMKAASYHEKEYQCRVNKPVTDDFLKKMAAGVSIQVPDKNHVMHRKVTRPCEVRRMGIDRFAITLTQGYNRQIRRMCQVFGYEVVELKRVRLMNLKLGNLPEGRNRELSDREVASLKAMADTKKSVKKS